MMTGTKRPVSPLDREVVARIEVGETTIGPALARTLVTGFLIALAALPLVEWFGPARESGAALRPWSNLVSLPSTAASAPGVASADTAWNRVVAFNREVLSGFSAFETALEDSSAVGRLLRPPAQALLSGWLGAGNERVYVGRDGWLFYRPDVEYVTGHGFLEPRQIERRAAAAPEYEAPLQPDPRPAILRFARDLEARGIALVVVPTPVKPTVHPERLSSRSLDAGPPLQNASYDAFVDGLRREGILVFDPAPILAHARVESGTAQYLRADTHWRPEAMQRAARALAAFIETHVTLPAVPAPGYRVEPREARQAGDTAAMLDLSAGQTLYPLERVALEFVVAPDGEPWRPFREADVLVLGDSFSNIYSLPSMGWGEAAGFIEHLSHALNRSLDRVVQNDQGAAATRRLLSREVTGATDRLAGKRVVVWQFAARELAQGDWTVIELPSAGVR